MPGALNEKTPKRSWATVLHCNVSLFRLSPFLPLRSCRLWQNVSTMAAACRPRALPLCCPAIVAAMWARRLCRFFSQSARPRTPILFVRFT